MIIQCVDNSNAPLNCWATFFYEAVLPDGQSVRQSRMHQSTSGRFTVTPLDGSMPIEVWIRAESKHWSAQMALDRSMPEECVICLQPMIDPDDFIWWRWFVGRNRFNPTLGRGIRVGVVDHGFNPRESLGHVTCVDIEGEELVTEDVTTHGEFVTKIIGERGPTLSHQGIAPGCDIVVVDIATKRNEYPWSLAALASAIIDLVLDHQVDLINISGGVVLTDSSADQDALVIIQQAIRIAEQHGVVVFAATGNADEDPVSYPAAMDGVIGVGSVGVCGLGYEDSLIAAFELASRRHELTGRHPDNVDIYAALGSSWMGKLDCVAPGVGVVVRLGTAADVELTGTSFACPIALAVVACELQEDRLFRSLSGPNRSAYVRRLCGNICVDLRLPSTRQGMGMPYYGMVAR